MDENLSKAHDANPWAREYEENSQTRRSDIVGMTWEEGKEHTIRVLPPTKKGGLPFVKYMIHWIPVKTGIKDKPIVHSVDKKCTVCKFVSLLWSEVYRLKEEDGMTDKSPEVVKILKQISKLRGKRTYDMNIIHRQDEKTEDKKIKIKRLVAGPSIWKPIIELGNSSKWGNPSDPGKRGYDLTVTVEGEGLKREYTILPDPERRALTDEEVEAIKTAYDLEKCRTFTSDDDLLEILEVAKPPLDGINLKKLKKQLKSNGSDDDDASTTAQDDDDNLKTTSSKKPDDDDDDETPPPSNTKPTDDKTPPPSNKKPTDDDDDDNNNEDKEAQQKENKAFAASPTEESEDERSEGASDDDEDIVLANMDCRGTYDADDVGCKDCKVSGDCKTLRKEFKQKVEQLEIDTSGLTTGAEIEAAIKEKEKAIAIAAKNKSGKMGKAGTDNSGAKRKVPF